MKKVLDPKRIKAGSRKNNVPRLVGSIVTDMLQGWNRNTDLSVDLKTVLHSDLSMKTGKEYQGVLRLNFRPVKMDGDFSIERYAIGVSNELLWALEGLVEKR